MPGLVEYGVIYADPYSYGVRQKLWNELLLLSQALPNVPWLVGGDFNDIRCLSERSDNSLSSFPKESLMFHDKLNAAELHDLPATGPLFTWCNNRSTDPVSKKLDRLMVNDVWFETFPNTTSEFLPPGCSDHCAGCVNILVPVQNNRRKPFKFFNFWTKNEEFLNTVKQVWDATTVQGCYMFQLCKKLKALKQALRKLNSKHYADLPNKLQEELHKLHLLQVDLFSCPTAKLIQVEHDQAQKVATLQLAEESFYKQKSRIKWLQEGDSNTNYFHKIATVRKGKNTIKLPTSMVDFLQQPITDLEIKEVVFSSPRNRAPGPDGYTSEFYKAAWPVVGDLVTKAIQEFFSSGKILREMNSTIISLVPKVLNPVKMTEFRPIACCNILYKFITKILANKLKQTLPLFISKNQCAFVEGRQMVENVLLAQEVVKHYHKPQLSPRCALKIDLMKAFDFVSWDFIFQVLISLGFPAYFVNLLKICITTPMFSIVFNGNLCGYFSGKKGVRQGDPLSPYIFVVCMEVLSRMLNHAAIEGKFAYHPKCKKVQLTHLCFADDLIIFTNGSITSLDAIDDVLKQFYIISGLQVNYAKSELFCCGLHEWPYSINESLWKLLDDHNVRWSRYKWKNFACLAGNAIGKGFFKCADCFNPSYHELPRWIKQGNLDPKTNQTVDFLIPDMLEIKLEKIKIGLDFRVGTGTWVAAIDLQA
ncbi:hypothetical protein SLEP1_g1354 [Rubroshorea leprosula]|uniref:Reverse transcriptase domain-containing protein n=1 Tax=Rubroshorea leprosula TaxID=152421 RepID=A0AAV5HMA3_9ROSI|nr:hypothetical protein SLEP1_g1354 [Rubroshorea leprosula]